jgi:E3 ubiquitin-protein ligase BRE1
MWVNLLLQCNILCSQFHHCLGKKDFKDEIHVMAAALSKEMEMMENQLNRSKDAASEALALREEAESLRTLLAKKVCH